MLDELEGVASELNMMFGFGSTKDLDDIAQSLTSGFLLFHDGYFKGDGNLDGQGAQEDTHNLILDICLPSKLHDKPVDKRENIRLLREMRYSVLKLIYKLGVVKSERFVAGLNLTTRNLDVIQLTIVIKLPAVSLCNY